MLSFIVICDIIQMMTKIWRNHELIKNYIFDFGNVLAEFYPDKLTAPFVQNEEIRKKISDVVFDRIYWDKLDIGTITDEEVKKGICSRLPDEFKSTACMVYDNWVKSLTPVKNMQKLVYDIKKTDKRLYLLSNISIGFANSYKNVEWINEILSSFDGLVFSGVVGLIKPDKEIFQYICDTFSLKADECLFIDDSQKNIDGAKDFGINGYLFDGDAQKLREYLHI